MDVELAEIRDFLAHHAPYDALPADELDRLPARLEVRYARRGSYLRRVGDPGDVVFVVRSGAVDIRNAEGVLVERAEAGASFGMSAILEGGPSQYEFAALEDALLLAIPEDVFLRICAEHPEARTWFDRRHRGRLHQAAAPSVHDRTGLRTLAGALVRRPPETGASALTVREAATRMREANVSSLIVVDDGRLVGIVTDRDLRNRVVADGASPDTLVRDVMTPSPVTVGPTTSAFDLLMEMVNRGVHHMPVVDGPDVVGMVTSTDLMRLERADPVHVVADVRRSRDLTGVVRASERLPAVVQRLVDAGSSAEEVGRVVTAVGDALERRLLDLALEAAGPAPAPWCWVVLGSRARIEQALGADQDHALVLDDEAGPDDDAWFAALAEEVSDGLVACGYPLCPGGVMARNPPWRRTLGQWRRAVAGWAAGPDPEAVLRSSIAFDMRPLAGTLELGTELHADMVRAASDQLYLAYLTRNALESSPPLGFFRGFVLESAGEHVDTLDLKRRGLNPVVDLARVHALAFGSTRVNTATRLREVAAAGRMDATTATELVEAYEVIAQTRLRHHVRLLRAGQPPDNYVRPEELGTLERRHLRDAFGVVKEAQSVLARSRLLSYL